MSAAIKRNTLLLILATLVVALFAAVTPALADDSQAEQAYPICKCGLFTDEDGDGICDFANACKSYQKACINAAEQAHGKMFGAHKGGNSYIDEDGDGVCDNAATRQGMGYGRGAGNGAGCSNSNCGHHGWQG